MALCVCARLRPHCLCEIAGNSHSANVSVVDYDAGAGTVPAGNGEKSLNVQMLPFTPIAVNLSKFR